MAGSMWNSIIRSHLDAPVDAHFGESIVFIPMTSSPNGRRIRDPNRVEVRCTGVMSKKTRRIDLQTGNRTAGGRGGHDMRLLVEGSLPRLSVSDAAFAQGAAPRQGDRVEVDGERYEVASARHDGTSRYVLDLVVAVA